MCFSESIERNIICSATSYFFLLTRKVMEFVPIIGGSQIVCKCLDYTSIFLVLIRHTRCCQNELNSAAINAKAMDQPPNQKRDFSTSRTTIHMRFVDNKQKFIVRVRIQPILCICPYFGLDRAKEHIFKHRIVRNENVGAKPLHLKPGNQFCILIIGDMIAIIKFPKKLMEILFDRKFSIFNQLLQKRLFFIRFCIKHFGVSRNK